jgi:lipid-binding SYLF domain-containing protein
MRASIFSVVAILLTAYLAMPAHATPQEDGNQAVTIIERFQEIPEKSIPAAVMRDAKGLAILTVTRGGFIITGKGGSGLVIA